MKNEFYGVVTLSNFTQAIKDELIFYAYNEFNCTGVEELSPFDEQEALEKVPENLKVMTGGLDRHDGEIIEQKVFTGSGALLKFYFEGSIKKINFDMNSFVSSLPSDYSILAKKEILKNQEWRDCWKDNFQKIEISERLAVLPPWEKTDRYQQTIIIEPGLGFGTGNHETTFLCLEFLSQLFENQDFKKKSTLDLGCGSGILGIYCKKYLNSQVKFVDIDSDALENCQKNLDLNNISENFELKLRDSISKESKYDLIIANILLPVLKEEKSFIIESLKDNGMVLFSGILKDQVDSLIEIYSSDINDVSTIEIKTKGEWAAVLIK